MATIKNLDMYLETIELTTSKNKFLSIIKWIKKEFPELTLEIKWNQPMFIKDDTFILSLSALKNHYSIAPEYKTMELFKGKIKKSKFSQTKMLFRVKYTEEMDFELLREIINYNIKDKEGFTKFWR